MKHLLIAVILVLNLSAKASITYAGEISGAILLDDNPAHGQIKINIGSGAKILVTGTRFVINEKFSTVNDHNSTYHIYNDNFTLDKTVVVDTSGIKYPGIPYVIVTSKLFNTDDKIEFLTTYEKTDGTARTVVRDEDGLVLFDNNELCWGVMLINDNYFMVTYDVTANKTKFYQLEGSLPCSACSSGTVGSRKLERDFTEVSIYPNPASDVTNVNINSSDSNLNLSVYGAGGQLIMSQSVESGSNQVDLSGTNSGSYVIIVTGNSGFLHSETIIRN